MTGTLVMDSAREEVECSAGLNTTSTTAALAHASSGNPCHAKACNVVYHIIRLHRQGPPLPIHYPGYEADAKVKLVAMMAKVEDKGITPIRGCDNGTTTLMLSYVSRVVHGTLWGGGGSKTC